MFNTSQPLYEFFSKNIAWKFSWLWNFRFADTSIYNFNNGARYDTYVIEGTDDNTVGINGPSARLCYKGDRIVVAQYVVTDEKINPRVLFFDDQNREVEFESVF